MIQNLVFGFFFKKKKKKNNYFGHETPYEKISLEA